jgi:hypothetical protein
MEEFEKGVIIRQFFLIYRLIMFYIKKMAIKIWNKKHVFLMS